MDEQTTHDIDFEAMRAVGHLTAQCLRAIKPIIQPGTTTADINLFVKDFQKRHGLKNSQYKYFGFPGHCCTSVNEVICHGIPSKSVVLNDGDIVKVDVTFSLDGWHGDSCCTYPVGVISDELQRLIAVSKIALWAGCLAAKPGNKISDIGRAINKYVKGEGMSVVYDYCGHGIGRKMHMPPLIPHAPQKQFPDMLLKPGMTFTIEPMINLGKKDYLNEADGWTVKTADGSYSAQFEHTLGITEDGHEVFTI